MALKDILHKISPTLAGLMGQGMGQGGNALLVAVLEEFSARGVLVRKGKKGSVELVRFMEVNFETSIDNTKLRLAHLFKQWGAITAKRILIVSDEFISTVAELPKPPKAGRFGKKKADEALKAAGRYEISPMLDYPATEAMVGVYVPPSPKGEFDEYGIDDASTVEAHIFALHEKHYESIEHVCRSLKLKLVGVMPQEIFAFAHCASAKKNMDVKLLSVDNEKPRVLINWRPYDALIALTVNQMPVSFRQTELHSQETSLISALEVVQEVIEEYEGPLKSKPLIILGGENAEDAWRPVVREHFPKAEVKRWDLTYDLPDVDAPGVVPPRYMTALSAASQAFCKQCCNLLVDNHVPVHTKIVAHPLALPALILAFFIFCMGVEASWLKFQVYTTENTIAALEADKAVLDAAVKRGQDAVNTYNNLSKEKRETQAQITLLNSGLYDRQYLVRALLAGIIASTPSSIQLNSVQQFSDQVWFVEGTGKRQKEVSKYVVDLKDLPMVRQCRLEKTTQFTDTKSKEDYFSFSLQIRLEDE